MIHFKKKEKTRADFGQMMDYFLEKNWCDGYFMNDNSAVKCIDIVKNFCTSNNIAEDNRSLESLLQQDLFFRSSDCDQLLKIFAENCFHFPFYTIECYNEDTQCFSNYFFDEVFEDSRLPFYFILYKADQLGEGASYRLVNKKTGRLHSFEMNSIIPSDNLHILYGRFNFSKLDRHKYYKIIFDVIENSDEIDDENFVQVDLKESIGIPDELLNWTEVSFIGITPHGTNIDCSITPVEHSDDIDLINKLKDFRKDFLPF